MAVGMAIHPERGGPQSLYATKESGRAGIERGQLLSLMEQITRNIILTSFTHAQTPIFTFRLPLPSSNPQTLII